MNLTFPEYFNAFPPPAGATKFGAPFDPANTEYQEDCESWCSYDAAKTISEALDTAAASLGLSKTGVPVQFAPKISNGSSSLYQMYQQPIPPSVPPKLSDNAPWMYDGAYIAPQDLEINGVQVKMGTLVHMSPILLGLLQARQWIEPPINYSAQQDLNVVQVGTGEDAEMVTYFTGTYVWKVESYTAPSGKTSFRMYPTCAAPAV